AKGQDSNALEAVHGWRVASRGRRRHRGRRPQEPRHRVPRPQAAPLHRGRQPALVRQRVQGRRGHPLPRRPRHRGRRRRRALHNPIHRWRFRQLYV
ncbi:MAG: FIG038648: MoaD and/or ThiS families, partial [uncultured Rubrobacteraceae bacterium]